MRERLILLAAAVAAFGASLGGGFHLDDFALFVDPAITSASGWWEVWRPSQTRPLTWFTFWLNYQAGGQEAWGYHLVNLALHAAAVLLVWELARRIAPGRTAFVAAALFAVHPIQTEAVVYVFARAIVLATIFCLLSFRSWLDGRKWPAVAWFALALLAKEEVVAFPLALWLIDRKASRGPQWFAMLALSAAAGVRVLWAAAATAGSGAGAQAGISPWQYLAVQGMAVPRYFGLLIVPWGFTVEPDIRGLPWGWVPVVAVAALAWWRLGDAGRWFVAGLILLAPSSSLLPSSELAADRRMYLPMVAFAIAAALVLARARLRYLVAAGAVLIALSAARTLVWRSDRSLWEDAVARAPARPLPKVRLARAVGGAEGLALLREAAELAPRDPAVASETGRAYLALGRNAEALGEFGRALALAPRDPGALNNRGGALLALGQKDAAAADFERALAVDPCLFEARLNLRRLGIATAAPSRCRYTPEQRAALISR